MISLYVLLLILVLITETQYALMVEDGAADNIIPKSVSGGGAHLNTVLESKNTSMNIFAPANEHRFLSNGGPIRYWHSNRRLLDVNSVTKPWNLVDSL
jgi:hypothetical protein